MATSSPTADIIAIVLRRRWNRRGGTVGLIARLAPPGYGDTGYVIDSSANYVVDSSGNRLRSPRLPSETPAVEHIIDSSAVNLVDSSGNRIRSSVGADTSLNSFLKDSSATVLKDSGGNRLLAH